MENNVKEIRISLLDKAYVRAGKNADLNWRTINAKEGIDTNNAEPLVVKNSAGSEFDRQVLMSFDISAFRSIDYKHVFLMPSFGSIDSYVALKFTLLEVDPASWQGDSVTWNTKPAYGKALCGEVAVSGLARAEITEAVTEALAAGRDVISFALVIVTKGGDAQNTINPKTVNLVATTEEKVQIYTTKLVEDEAENAAIWAWAEKVYDEWYERYQKLLKTGLAKVKHIDSDPAQYTKEVHTAKSGFAPATGWTPELVRQYTFKTRTYGALDDLGKYSDYNKEQKFDEFGGLIDEEKRQEATGFFYSKKIGDRWWIFDPNGYPCYLRCMHAVNPCYLGSPNHTNAAIVRYGSLAGWAEKTAELLTQEWHFNLSDTEFANNTSHRMPIQRGTGFAGAYGSRVGSNCSNGGSTRFSENNTMNVFDPGFIDFCDERAQSLSARKDDKYTLGYTSDNELPMDPSMLYNYLGLDCTKPMNRYSYAVAWTWLIKMLNNDTPTPEDITKDHMELFRGFVWDRYYNIVTGAMRKYDPNHMILGTRFLTHVKNAEWVLRFASLYLDAMTINWYGQWEPDADDLQELCERADLPMMVTEFYTKAMDSGLANTRGAGWAVPTQQDRADFFQHFTLRLLECKNFVGWHWHQYIDDDPSPAVIYKEDGKTWRDQSNIDANKGIVNIGHKPYEEVVNGMAEINRNVYRLIDHFDAKYAD